MGDDRYWHRYRAGLAVAGVSILTLAACVDEPEVPGQRDFAQNCAACHGTDAQGNGPAAPALPVPPPDLTLLARDNGGEFPRVAVMSKIDGYRSAGTIMPEFGAGDLGPTVVVEFEEGIGTPVPERLLALSDYLETLQR